MSVVGTLNLLFRADTSEAAKKIATFKEKFSANAGAMMSKAGMFSASLLAVSSAITAIAVKVGKANREINKSAEALGISYKRMKAFEDVLGTYGVSATQTHDVMKKLSRNIAEAADGSTGLEKDFNKLGLTSKELIDLRADEQFFKVQGALSKMTNQSEKSAIMFALLGKSSIDMSGALDRVGDSFEDLVVSSSSSMSLLTDQQRAGIEVMTQQWEKLGQATGGFFDKVVGAGAPVLSKFFEKFTSWTDHAATEVEDMVRTLIGFSIFSKDILGDFAKNWISTNVTFGLYKGDVKSLGDRLDESFEKAVSLLAPTKQIAEEMAVAEKRLNQIKSISTSINAIDQESDFGGSEKDKTKTSVADSFVQTAGTIDAKNIMFGAQTDFGYMEQQNNYLAEQTAIQKVILRFIESTASNMAFASVK